MNLYHIRTKNYYTIKNRPKNTLHIDIDNMNSLGDIISLLICTMSLSYEYNMPIKITNNNTKYNILNSIDNQSLPLVYQVISEPNEIQYNKILIVDTVNYLFKGKYLSYKYSCEYLPFIKKELFEPIDNMIVEAKNTFNKNSDNKKIVMVHINKTSKEIYYITALNRFFSDKNKDDYKLFIFIDNMITSIFSVFKNYNYSIFSGNEEKLFLIMICCEHFIISNSALPLMAYYFRNNINATATFPPIWNDLIPSEELHISNYTKLNNTHIINDKVHVNKQLNAMENVKKISYNPKLCNQYVHNNPNMAIVMTHIELMLKATELNLPYIVICNDNIVINNPYNFLDSIEDIMSNSWNVIAIGPDIEHNNNEIKTLNVPILYIVHKDYYKTLLDIFVEGRDLLIIKSLPTEDILQAFWKRIEPKKYYTITNTDIMSIDNGIPLIASKEKTKEVIEDIIPVEYLDTIPIFLLNSIREIHYIHSFFLNYKCIIVNINCKMIPKKFIKYSLTELTNTEYDIIKLQSTYNEKTFNEKINSTVLCGKLLTTKINYNNTAFLLNNNAIKKIINKIPNLVMGKLTIPIFMGPNDKLWLDYYNNINMNNT